MTAQEILEEIKPLAPDYIRKVRARGTIGKKRKTAKC
jgi:hypothetical protein